jgi:hypothetical protein
MSGIRTLFSSCLEPAPLLAYLQEPLQQQHLRSFIHQTPAKFGQQGEVKARIRQF